VANELIGPTTLLTSRQQREPGRDAAGLTIAVLRCAPSRHLQWRKRPISYCVYSEYVGWAMSADMKGETADALSSY